MLVLLKSKPEITWYIYLYPMCTTVDHVSDVKFTLYIHYFDKCILIYKIWIYLNPAEPHNVHIGEHGLSYPYPPPCLIVARKNNRGPATVENKNGELHSSFTTIRFWENVCQ